MAERDPGLLKRIVTTLGGLILILLGIVGLFLPILQGVLLIVAGLGLLSIGNERLRKWIRRVTKRYFGQELSLRGIRNRMSSHKKPPHSYEKSGLEKGSNDER
ncbi:MAG: hypothetical protein GTO13_02140 [Proteobacteria bacterium]|nr:hypothetical protein [Pseudomonadota bacterium]